MDIGVQSQADDISTRARDDASPSIAPSATPIASTRPTSPLFYRLDYRKVTLAEYWQENPRGVLGHALRRLLRVRLTACSTDDPCVESLASFEVARSAIPGMIAQRFSVAMSQLTSLGFRDPIWHAIEDDVQRTTTYLATMPHDSGRMWARVHNRIWHIRTPATSTVFCEIVTELAGEQFIWSLNIRPDLAAPSACTVVRLVGATPNQLLAAHQSAVAESGAGKPLPIHSSDDLRQSVDRLHAAVRDFHLARGVFAPVSDEDRQTSVQFRDQVASASSGGSRYPEIIAEIANLQNAKASRSSGLLLLAASIVLFFGAGLTKMGSMKFSADFLLILVGVLLLHETGHWVAMRVFGYRNLKMFFIPFFGAAVTGRHYNVAGWKKVIVSLMGPVPGIVVGSALGATGVMLHSALLTKIALTAIALNAFNLLPLLPLDGGWAVHAILFSRHHLLELAFRVAALGALFLLAVFSSDNILIGVAVAMSISLPAMYKVAKITSELRKSPLALTSDDGQTLPQAAADAIIDRIKAAFPAKLTNRAAAQYTLQVFENVNARPPRVLASIGLGALHFGSMIGAAVAAVLIYAGMSNGAWHKLDANTMRVVHPQPDSALAEPRNTVFAIYGSSTKMRSALGDLQRGASSETAVASFGDMAILSLPAEDVDGLRDVQTTLEKRGTDFVISTPTSPALVRMSCTAKSRTAASAIDRELGDYFEAGEMNLSPPWQSTAWTADDRARYARARRTLRQLTEAEHAALMDPRMLALYKRGVAARRADDRAGLARLVSEREALSEQMARERTQKVRMSRGADTALVTAYEQAKRDSSESADSLFAATAAPLLGTLPLTNGRPLSGALNLSASGRLVASELSIALPTLRFANPFQGPPALARWLLANGCTDVRYSVASGMESQSRMLRRGRSKVGDSR